MRTSPRLTAALLALLPLGAFAQAPDARRPPLYVLEDGDNRVYLLGSIHALPAGALPLPAAVEAAYADAAVVAFELDLDAARAGAGALVMQKGRDETTTGQALSADQKAALNTLLGQLGLPAGALDAVEPWVASMTIGALAIERAGADAEGVDAHLFARAGADGKERAAFETLEQQIAILDDVSTEEQVTTLMQSVGEGLDEMTSLFGRMQTAWATGDDSTLAAMIREGAAAAPGATEALFGRRNRAWVPQIEALLARSGRNALVVVGAGHLVGEGSVVELLRAAGHTVRRL
jgi:uncharacterized protein